MNRIVILPLADRDITEHTDYIARSNRKAARRFQNAIKKAFKALLAMPGMGSLWDADQPPWKDLRAWTIRGFGNHIIFYRATDEGIEVVRVLHASRDIEALFEES